MKLNGTGKAKNETLKTIHALRSTHGNFSEREVTGQDLETIISACLRAANASARQSYSIVVLEDRDRVKEIVKYPGSKALVFCVDFNRILDAATHLGKTFSVDGLNSFVTGSTDAILAAQTAVIAARSIGVDSLFTNSVHRGSIEKTCKLLNLPDQYCFPVVSLVLGYEKGPPAPQKGRLSGPGVVHRGTYQRLSGDQLAQMVAEYDDPQRHMGMSDDYSNQGFDHYLDWFYSVWAANQSKRVQQPEPMFNALKRSGFLEIDT